MKLKIYHASSGFWNVNDPCSFDSVRAECQEVVTIEVPDNYKVFKTSWEETVVLDEKGYMLEPMYVHKKNNTPCKPYISLLYMDEYERTKRHDFKILDNE